MRHWPFSLAGAAAMPGVSWARIATAGRRRRRALRGLGAETPSAGQRGRAVLRLGRTPPPDARCATARGVWELFMPGLRPGRALQVRAAQPRPGACLVKADPYARATELRPATASLVVGPSSYPWRDSDWLRTARPARTGCTQPMSIYEVHFGSWRRDADGAFLNYRELAAAARPYMRARSASRTSSSCRSPSIRSTTPGATRPPAISRRRAATARPTICATSSTTATARGIGVLLDWVPGHFPRDAHGLAHFDGTRALRIPRSAQGRAPRLGHAGVQLRAARGAQLPALERLLLARGIPLRRAARRRGGLDALSRLSGGRRAGSPNRYGGRENLEAIDFLRELNATVHARAIPAH